MTACRTSILPLLLLAACSSTPVDDEDARRTHWRGEVQGIFACRSRNDLEAFLDRIRKLPPRRPRNAGGGSYELGSRGWVYDDLYPLDEIYDLYIVWNDKARESGIRSVEVVGFPDLRAKINPGHFNALMALHRSPPAENCWSFDPVLLLRAINALRELGSEAQPALRSYVDLARRLPFEERRKYSLDETRLFPVLQIHSTSPSPFRLGAGGVSNPGAATWPLFPLVLEGDLPFIVVMDYFRAGKGEDPSGRLGPGFVLRAAPMSPGTNPVEAVEALTASSRWVALLEASDSENPKPTAQRAKQLRQLIRSQALEALAPIYSPPPDEPLQDCCKDPDEIRWTRVVQEVRALGIRWDPGRQDFIRTR